MRRVVCRLVVLNLIFLLELKNLLAQVYIVSHAVSYWMLTSLRLNLSQDNVKVPFKLFLLLFKIGKDAIGEFSIIEKLWFYLLKVVEYFYVLLSVLLISE